MYPKDDLVRAVFGRAEITDGRTLVGYPVVFDTFTTINSYEGQFRERIAPGALNRTLANNGDKVKVLFNHGMDPAIGEKPLGKASVQQVDSRGLYVEVPLSDTSYNNDLIALMRDGALDGMSFRFSVVDETWNTPKTGLPERTITELKLYEYGPVTFPAYEATTVGVRSHVDYGTWRALSDEQRRSIADLIGIAHDLFDRSDVPDLRTLDDQPALGHLDDEARDSTTAGEPAPTHPAADTHNLQLAEKQAAARRLLRIERARQSGAIQ